MSGNGKEEKAELEKMSLTRDEKFLVSSKKIMVNKGKKYIASTEVIGFHGGPFSVYFGILALDEEGIEVDRRFRYIDDFSSKKISIKFPFIAATNQIIPFYKINADSASNSSCEVAILPVENVTITSYEQTNTQIDSFNAELSLWKKFEKNEFPYLLEPDRLDVNCNISFMDTMYMWDPAFYFEFGKQTLQSIEIALRLTNKTTLDIKKILDLPCGYGRIHRYLKSYFPSAQLTACDIDHDAVDFCKNTFDSVPVYSKEDLDQLQIKDKFDLIWCGSLLTHIDYKDWKSLLNFFSSHLSNDGILVFTVLGRPASRLMREPKNPYLLDESKIKTVLEDYEKTGFGFVKYRGEKNYGISLASPSFILSILEKMLDMRILMFAENNWFGQDIISIAKI